MSQPTLFFNTVYFTSYQPELSDSCNPTGNAFIYAIDYSYGTSVFDFNAATETDFQVKDIKDTFFKISDSSIPSGVKVITRGSEAAGLISAGEGISGVGENQGTTIPGPPGGVFQMIWETE